MSKKEYQQKLERSAAFLGVSPEKLEARIEANLCGSKVCAHSESAAPDTRSASY